MILHYRILIKLLIVFNLLLINLSAQVKISDNPVESIKILPLGDSITQSNYNHFSYRYNLWKILIDAYINFDFVGSLDSNYGGNPNWPDHRGFQFDADNEGHWGWRADEILDSIPNWLNNYKPDLVLCHIGSNDCNQNQSTESTVSEIKQIIQAIRIKNPNVTILLAKLIPWDNLIVNNRIVALNSEMDGIAAELNTAESEVIVVDQYSGFDASADTFDGVHPDESGEEKMAQVWFSGIIDLFPKLSSKIFLQGSFDNSGTMTLELNNENIIPRSQPFTELPWNYQGSEYVNIIPSDITDWVFVSLRIDMNSATTIARRACFIKSDGTIVDLDGASAISFAVENNDYYYVVEHQNHISVMSGTKITLIH